MYFNLKIATVQLGISSDHLSLKLLFKRKKRKMSVVSEFLSFILSLGKNKEALRT